jgi:hypothetical protein
VSVHVSLDGHPGRFECVRVEPEEWNGYLVPVMTVAQVLAAVGAMPWVACATYEDTIRIVFGADEGAEDAILPVHPDGTVRWEGWRWVDVLVPNLPCPTCGAAAHADCAPDCTDDEALRYGEESDHTDPAPASATRAGLVHCTHCHADSPTTGADATCPSGTAEDSAHRWYGQIRSDGRANRADGGPCTCGAPDRT